MLQPASTSTGPVQDLFVSVNPDLISDFGHFLNYEKRLAETCERSGLGYVGLCNAQFEESYPNVVRAFDHASGHYAMTRTAVVGQEAVIAAEFREKLLIALDALPGADRWRRRFVFVYCGSSRLALALAELPWPEDLSLCVNAFWDFLVDEPCPADLPKLKFQRAVKLLAMSELHAECWQDVLGLRFDWIPNPPPLMGDGEAYTILRGQFGVARDHQRLRVLVPGLMTLGKGQGTTQGLLDHLRQHGTGDIDFVFRDRKRELGENIPENVRMIKGDLSDEEVIDLYRNCDIVLLPYEAEVFAVRTSGALVDTLIMGAVPLVLEGTWLAHQCRKFDAGRVLPDAKARTVLDAVTAVGQNLEKARLRALNAGALYLGNNTWSALVKRVVRQHERVTQPNVSLSAVSTGISLFAAANQALRAGQYATAAHMYSWLHQNTPLSIYETNLQMCVQRSGRTLNDLLADHQ